ncbi:hypothetical protein GAY28_36925 [Azospirillum brasilense]|nr:hypothetical protein [Azospirillum brasilense]
MMSRKSPKDISASASYRSGLSRLSMAVKGGVAWAGDRSRCTGREAAAASMVVASMAMGGLPSRCPALS